MQQDGQINHVVVSVGGWRTDGPLSTVSTETYQKVVSEFTLPHFNCYKTFVKILSQQPKSTYTMITGTATHFCKIFFLLELLIEIV